MTVVLMLVVLLLVLLAMTPTQNAIAALTITIYRVIPVIFALQVAGSALLLVLIHARSAKLVI